MASYVNKLKGKTTHFFAQDRNAVKKGKLIICYYKFSKLDFYQLRNLLLQNKIIFKFTIIYI
jgi:hypothetical protein